MTAAEAVKTVMLDAAAVDGAGIGVGKPAALSNLVRLVFLLSQQRPCLTRVGAVVADTD